VLARGLGDVLPLSNECCSWALRGGSGLRGGGVGDTLAADLGVVGLTGIALSTAEACLLPLFSPLGLFLVDVVVVVAMVAEPEEEEEAEAEALVTVLGLVVLLSTAETSVEEHEMVLRMPGR